VIWWVVAGVWAAVSAGWLCVFIREGRSQRRDAAVVAACTPSGVPEWRLVFLGGECDGGSIVVSASIFRRMQTITLQPEAPGGYVCESRVEIPGEGGVLTFRWDNANRAAA
jgi:hypothetical protein